MLQQQQQQQQQNNDNNNTYTNNHASKVERLLINMELVDFCIWRCL